MNIDQLTNDELVRYCISLPNLTPLENELMHRLEAMLNEQDEFQFPQWVKDLAGDEELPAFLKDL